MKRMNRKSTACFMCINMRKLNRFYNTLIFIIQKRLKSVSRAEHELLDVEFFTNASSKENTREAFNY